MNIRRYLLACSISSSGVAGLITTFLRLIFLVGLAMKISAQIE